MAGTSGIDRHLEMPEQARRILHLIDDQGRRMAAEEALGFLLGLRGLGR